MPADDKDPKRATEPKPDAQPITVNLIQPDRAAEGARAMAEGRALNMDQTVPGGRYRVGDRIVDANGEPIKGKDD